MPVVAAILYLVDIRNKKPNVRRMVPPTDRNVLRYQFMSLLYCHFHLFLASSLIGVEVMTVLFILAFYPTQFLPAKGRDWEWELFEIFLPD